MKNYFLFLFIIAVFTTVGCKRSEPQKISIEKDSKDVVFFTTKVRQKNPSFKVTFINPGEHSIDATTGDFWTMVGNFMAAAAEDFNADLDIFYAERQFVNEEIIIDRVLKQKVLPDYIIVVNEKLVAPSLIKKADSAGVKIFLILNDLTKEQKAAHKNPRERYVNWIGSLVPDNITAGYLIAENTIRPAKKKFQNISVSAINGNRATPASVEREIGMINYMDKLKLKPNQITYAEWDTQLAYETAAGLLKRYPDTNVFWTANDPMALGALKACVDAGKTPGKDIFIGGLNWSTDALEKVKTGELACSVGGHFMVGGWVMVILNDYQNGIDFSSTEGTLMQLQIFNVITSANVQKYLNVFGDQNWNKINFNKFCKKNNNFIKKYDFSINNILSQF